MINFFFLFYVVYYTPFCGYSDESFFLYLISRQKVNVN